MTTETLFDMMHPAVRELALASGVKIMSEFEFRMKHGGRTRIHPDTNGNFDCMANDIVISDTVNSLVEFNNCIVHELMHATGHPTRLGRPTTVRVTNGTPTYMIGSLDINKEEQTAQYGSYLFFKQHGILDPQIAEWTDWYIRQFNSGSDAYKQDAQLALDYLNNLVYASKCNEKQA